MENKDGKNGADFAPIFVEITSDGDGVVTETASDGKMKFSFEETPRRGLVFEEGDFEDPPAPAVAPVIESATDVAEDSTVSTPVAEEETVKEEFTIPDVFDVAAEEERIASDIATTIVSTYVPRFTEVSETYRMNDDPRPRPRVTKVEEVKDEDAPAVDPTEEIESGEAIPDAVIVNLGQKAEEEAQTFSVYKFSDTDGVDSTEQREPTEADELEAIEKLVRPEETPEEASGEETQTESAPEEELPPIITPEKKPYRLPDPDYRGEVHVIDYPITGSGVSASEAPEGANESAPADKKRRGAEYTANIQRDGFKDKFLDSIMSVRIRLIASIVLAFGMLVFENLSLFGVDLIGILHAERFPYAMAIADLQFAACIFVLAIPEVIRAIKQLVKGRLTPEITLVFSLIVLALYTLIVTMESPLKYPYFGAIVAAQGIAAIIATNFKRGADFISFKRASAPGEKRILDKRLTRTLERENMALDGAVDEYKSKTARIFKTTFVSDFFKRSAKTVENSFNVATSLIVATLAALIGGILAFFIGNGWMDAAATFTVTALLTLPASSILVHKIPFYHATVECERSESAVIGESSIYDYSGVDVIAFEDTDIFGTEDVNLKRIIHYGDVDNMMKAMRQMSAIFANAGGPLSIIFTNSLDRKCPPAESPEIEKDGISGVVDGKRVCAGTEEYMLRHGIKIPDGASSRAGIVDSTKIMYGAEDGKIYVQFHIRYSFSEEFTMILPSLKSDKIVPLIYTRDPNVTGELMRTLTGGEDCIRVLKKRNPRIDEDRIYRRVSAGVVTSGDKISAINVILMAKKYVKLARKLSVAELVAIGTGTALAIALTLAGALQIGSLIFFGWQAVWSLALYIVSGRSFASRQEDEDASEVNE